MQPTAYPEINVLLAELLVEIQKCLGDKLVGYYVYGSLVWGGFEPGISDIDSLAALTEDLTDAEAERLGAMHAQFAAKHPQWDDHIEVQYFARRGLETFRTETHRMGNISPGEPFHIIEADHNWLMNWYFVRTYGVTLYGPPPQAVIAPIDAAEFFAAVREHVALWQTYVVHTRDTVRYRSYAVLTMCRALYSLTYGKQVSKREAAEWAMREMPQWSALIEDAWATRSEAGRSTPTYDDTERFIRYAGEQAAKIAPDKQ